jgi:hypothetical protein
LIPYGDVVFISKDVSEANGGAKSLREAVEIFNHDFFYLNIFHGSSWLFNVQNFSFFLTILPFESTWSSKNMV